MSSRMTKDDAQAWMAGWKALEAREREQLQKETHEEKLTALAFLMASVSLFDLSLLEREDAVAKEIGFKPA